MKRVPELSEYLKRAGLTQAELAERLQISQAHLSQIINGDRRPSLEVAARIQDITGIPMRSLLAGAA